MARTELGQRLKELREAQGLSQEALASLVGRSHGAIGGFESATVKKVPSEELLRRLAEVLHADLAELDELRLKAGGKVRRADLEDRVTLLEERIEPLANSVEEMIDLYTAQSEELARIREWVTFLGNRIGAHEGFPVAAQEGDLGPAPESLRPSPPIEDE